MHLVATLIGLYLSLSGAFASAWAIAIIWDCGGGVIADVEITLDPDCVENSFETLPAPLLLTILGGMLAYWGLAGS